MLKYAYKDPQWAAKLSLDLAISTNDMTIKVSSGTTDVVEISAVLTHRAANGSISEIGGKLAGAQAAYDTNKTPAENAAAPRAALTTSNVLTLAAVAGASPKPGKLLITCKNSAGKMAEFTFTYNGTAVPAATAAQ